MKGLRALTMNDFNAMVELKERNLKGAQDGLRTLRQTECFKYVDRAAWYDGLTAEEKQKAQAWRKEWKDVTETFVKPTRPYFV
jgi:hypothetical protein